MRSFLAPVTAVIALAGAVAAALFTASPTALAQYVPVAEGLSICGIQEALPATTPTTPSKPAPRGDGTLRVATYNVLHTQGRYADETIDRRVELLTAQIADSAADIVGLQEVTQSANHGNVAQRIADGLAVATRSDWHWCWYQSNPHVPGEPDTEPGGFGGPISQQVSQLARAGDAPWGEGVAVLTRFRITGQYVHRLPYRTAEVPVCVVDDPDDPLAGPTCAMDTRTIMVTRIDSSCGWIDFYTSHLANDETDVSEVSRIPQVLDALRVIDATALPDTAPDFYVGDFNTHEGGPVWQAIVDAGFVDAYRQAEPEAAGLSSGQDIDDPEPTVNHRIDFVMMRPGSEPVTATDAEMLGDEPVPYAGSEGETVVWPSDHYGVAVTADGVTCVSDRVPGSRSMDAGD